jgi:hypothetical protein
MLTEGQVYFYKESFVLTICLVGRIGLSQIQLDHELLF